jgi:methylphosphotriester-DNA--protein-cysteine methyltransferase
MKPTLQLIGHRLADLEPHPHTDPSADGPIRLDTELIWDHSGDACPEISERTLLAKMRTGQGLSPKIFIRKLRMKHAKQLLAQQTMSITEVATTVGIPDVSYFGKCFRREFGVSPSEMDG